MPDPDLPDAVRRTGFEPEHRWSTTPTSATRAGRSGDRGGRTRSRARSRWSHPSQPGHGSRRRWPTVDRRRPARPGARAARHQGPGVRRGRGRGARRRWSASRRPAGAPSTSCSPGPPSGSSPWAAGPGRPRGGSGAAMTAPAPGDRRTLHRPTTRPTHRPTGRAVGSDPVCRPSLRGRVAAARRRPWRSEGFLTDTRPVTVGAHSGRVGRPSTAGRRSTSAALLPAVRDRRRPAAVARRTPRRDRHRGGHRSRRSCSSDAVIASAPRVRSARSESP